MIANSGGNAVTSENSDDVCSLTLSAMAVQYLRESQQSLPQPVFTINPLCADCEMSSTGG
jgi:hypothetical protein